MKTITVAVSMLAVGTMAAGAADLSVKAPVAQPMAVPQASGYVEIYSGGSWLEDAIQATGAGTTRYDGWPIGGAGRANWWATRNFSVQLDAQAEGTQYKVPGEFLAFDPTLSGRFSTLSYLVGGHANLRDSQMGLVGAFGAIGDTVGNGGTNVSSGSNTGARHALGGLEGQFYWNALTLYGQGGYDATTDFGNIAIFDDVHAWFVRGTARYFFMPNVMIEGTGQYSKGAIGFSPSSFARFSPDTSFQMWRAHIKAEWKPEALPFSIFAKYEYNQTNYNQNPGLLSPDERLSENRVMAGLRVHLGQNTLLANDRTGATLDIADPLGSPASPLMFPGLGQVPLVVSDARLKRDISLVGRLDSGLGLYRYRYIWSDTEYVGVMAQEVALIQPKAVLRGFDGYLRVNYALLGVPFRTFAEWEAQHKAATVRDMAANPI